MKEKLKTIILILLVVIAIVLMVMYIIKNNAKKEEIEEYEPQEEISEEQERQTMVSLYFKNKTTQKVEPEARIVDVKEIVLNPYENLVDTLTELTEVNAIKILINGKENQSFKDEQINFEQKFIRNE